MTPARGTVKFRAIFTNDDESLFPNQFVNARLLVNTLEDATLLPNAVIQRNADGAFVYLVKTETVRPANQPAPTAGPTRNPAASARRPGRRHTSPAPPATRHRHPANHHRGRHRWQCLAGGRHRAGHGRGGGQFQQADRRRKSGPSGSGGAGGGKGAGGQDGHHQQSQQDSSSQ